MVLKNAEPHLPEHRHKRSRVLSVDMLRGITMALMILVNNPGDWDHVFGQLDHAEWNGCTLTDLVFPSFLTLMGMSVVFSLAGRVARGTPRGQLARHVVSRAARLMFLALTLSFFPRMMWHTFRYFGVLERISICFLLAGMVILCTRKIVPLCLVVLGLLVGYWALLRFVPMPHYMQPALAWWHPFLDPVDNLGAHIDRALVGFTQRTLHTGALFDHTSDPEGVLSTMGALSTTLIGAVCGLWIRQNSIQRMRIGVFSAGLALLVAGKLWSFWYPMNKALWTGSYVLFSAGACLFALSLCSLLVDGRVGRWPNWLRWSTWPWFVFGSNAIVAYVFSEGFVKVMTFIRFIDPDGDSHSLWSKIYTGVFVHQQSTVWSSLAFAVCYLCLCFLPNWALWHKRIFLKI